MEYLWPETETIWIFGSLSVKTREITVVDEQGVYIFFIKLAKDLIWLSLTWVFKNCVNLTFKVNFEDKKIIWIFLNLCCSLHRFFVYLHFFDHFNFWNTMFSETMQKFWRIGLKFCESQIKKSLLLIVYQKTNPCPQKFTTKVTLLYSNWQSHWLGNLQSIVLLHWVGRRWNAAGWNRIRHHFSVCMTNWKTPPKFRLKQ